MQDSPQSNLPPLAFSTFIAQNTCRAPLRRQLRAEYATSKHRRGNCAITETGIISTAHIAHELADGVKFSTTGQLLAVGSRSQESADPWTASRWNRDDTKLIVRRYAENEPQTVIVPAPDDLYTYEADTVAAHVADRQAPQMSWDDTLGNMRLLDAWRKEIELTPEQLRWLNLED